MALNLITNIGTELTLSSQWGDLSTLLDQVKTGIGNKIRVHSLTNWDSSTTKPAIAEGSLFDVGGSLYLADSDTALTDEAGLIDGTCHIKLVPAVDGLTVTPTLTNDSIPAWDETKHGWYDGADSFLPYEFTKASAVYSDKFEYEDKGKYEKKYSSGDVGIIGDVNLSGTINSLTIDNGNILSPNAAAVTGNSISGAFIYDVLKDIVDTVGDFCTMSGALYPGGTVMYYPIYAERASSTSITIKYAGVTNANVGASSSLIVGPTSTDSFAGGFATGIKWS